MLDIIARARITKVDAKQRLVYGRATQEVVDKSNEIFDYDRSKPHFEKWSQDAATATKAAGQEESLGNVRAMHKDVAAGKLTAIDFNDAEKAIDVVAFIADDAEWAKVEKGVYTGFSIGGKYADRWADPANPAVKRFEAIPAEISIVDNPCVPTATFEMIKADGATELRKFASASESTEETPATDGPARDAEKSAVPAARQNDQSDPAPHQASADPTPAADPAAAAPAAVAAVAAAAEKAADAETLAKAKSAAQAIHDHSVSMGASCSSAKADAPDDLAKRAAWDDAARESVNKLVADHNDLQKRFDDLAAERDTLAKRVKELEAEPAPAKGATKVVSIEKVHDTGDGSSDTIELPSPDSPEFAKAVMKAVHSKGAKPFSAL